jgi:hypothetical protein
MNLKKENNLTMKASELRIGNLVWDKMFLYSIRGITDILQAEISGIHNTKNASNEDFYKEGIVYSLNYENVEPIPLTEEWLLKFGFEKTDINTWGNKVIGIFFDGKIGSYNICNFKYVHQLQNLYFALCREELTQV